MNMKLTLLLVSVIAACALTLHWLANGADPAPATLTEDAPQQAPERGAMDHGATWPDLETPAMSPADAPDTEMVLGLEVRKDRNCVVQRHYVDLGNGTVTDAYSCVPISPETDDYERYGNEELRVLSYSDARAASVLGKRLVNVDLPRAEALLLRAVALQPDNVDPVMWLAAQAYSLRGTSQAAQVARANTYVLTRIARELGSDARIDWVLLDLERAGFSPDDVRRLDKDVRENLRRIRNIQLEVYGESTIEEVQL